MSVTTTTNRQSLEPANLGEAMKFAELLARSTMIPKDFMDKPANVLVAIQWGREIGLGPLQALQNIAVIGNRPSVWGDALIALVRGSPACQDVIETLRGEGDDMAATCTAIRRNAEPVVRTFTVADAKKAGLWGKSGPWSQYPKRMLQMRARGFALRDAFPDVLRGIITTEEAVDLPRDDFRGVTLDAAALPPDTPAQTRETINAEVPLAPKRTVASFLDDLEADLAAALTPEAVDAIIARDDVQSAQDKLSGAAKDRLNAMVKAAIDLTAAVVEGDAV